MGEWNTLYWKEIPYPKIFSYELYILWLLAVASYRKKVLEPLTLELTLLLTLIQAALK